MDAEARAKCAIKASRKQCIEDNDLRLAKAAHVDAGEGSLSADVHVQASPAGAREVERAVIADLAKWQQKARAAALRVAEEEARTVKALRLAGVAKATLREVEEKATATENALREDLEKVQEAANACRIQADATARKLTAALEQLASQASPNEERRHDSTLELAPDEDSRQLKQKLALLTNEVDTLIRHA